MLPAQVLVRATRAPLAHARAGEPPALSARRRRRWRRGRRAGARSAEMRELVVRFRVLQIAGGILE